MWKLCTQGWQSGKQCSVPLLSVMRAGAWTCPPWLSSPPSSPGWCAAAWGSTRELAPAGSSLRHVPRALIPQNACPLSRSLLAASRSDVAQLALPAQDKLHRWTQVRCLPALRGATWYLPSCLRPASLSFPLYSLAHLVQVTRRLGSSMQPLASQLIKASQALGGSVPFPAACPCCPRTVRECCAGSSFRASPAHV